MLGLALRIGLGDERAAQTITGVNQAKKTLALAHTHLHLIAFVTGGANSDCFWRLKSHLR